MNYDLQQPKERILTPLNLLLLVAFGYDSLFAFVNVIFSRLPIIGVVGEYIMPTFVIVLVLLNIFVYRTFSVHLYDLTVTIVILIMMCISYLLHPENQEFYNDHNMKLVFLKAIPFLYIGTNFRANKTTLKLLTILSYVAIVVNMAYVFYFMSSRDASDYNMHYAYLMLPHVLFAAHGLFNKELNIHIALRILLFVLGAFFILAMGTRGPILIMLAYLLVVICRNTVTLPPRKAAVAILITVFFAIYVFISYITLAEAIRDFISQIGLSTRALDIFLEGEYISETSGREEIYAMLWEKLFEEPLGYGIFGEWQFVNYSAHNIYLQVCMYFGLTLGSVVVIALLFFFGKAYFATQNKWARDVIMLYLVFTVVRNFFGGEFFSEYVFFLIGFSIRCLTNDPNIDDMECLNA